MKIGDESILFFSRVSLSKFSLESLFLSWVKMVFILGWEWNVKSQVFQNRAGLQLDWVASSSHEVIERPVLLFCPIVLQLAWRFNFWHDWHASTSFMGKRGIYTGVGMECEESSFSKQGWLATWLSREFQPRGNWTASSPILSYSAPTSVTLQLLAWLACEQLLAACSCESPARSSLAHAWTFLHTISLTTLTRIPPKYRVTKCWNTSKLGTK